MKLLHHGLDEGDLANQLNIVASQLVPRVRAVRPCTAGDGIATLLGEDTARVDAAVRAGRVSIFVPASGSASRLLSSVVSARLTEQGQVPPEPGWRVRFSRLLDHTGRLACWHGPAPATPDQVWQRLCEGPHCVFDRPKALIPFHRVGNRVVTPLAHQLAIAGRLAARAGGRVGLHLTASPQHLAELRATATASAPEAVSVRVSVQHPETDTIALHDSGDLVRDAQGAPAPRPGGHGAVLQNLGAYGDDVVFIRNIDNAPHPSRQAAVDAGRARLLSTLLVVESEVHEALHRLDGGDPSAIDAACSVLLRRFALSPPPNHDPRTWAYGALLRPLRVAGVAKAERHVGGSPWWVRDPDGRISLGFIEAAELAHEGSHSGDQRLLNPVEIVCSLRDHRGHPYRLSRFADLDAWIVSERHLDGYFCRLLERPGLWNGGMARWNTVFVAWPDGCFHPVKHLDDLLEDAHQPLE